ncbi:DUF3347 domain-containing protein [Aquimarina sp. AD1]|uniref:DUF3347 domain-containing protein n=1 Tax=Aquimarina sp. (strain AD1) TaxID=1714848 RepID=UPI000E46EE79|nr:DUF3347 domain-containing protein [Aquimarina sp. AD1]AXT56822.1 DUF3347 domain-containing protein [Aquimarina sp. AD1]RKN35914.1 DUF3347 domain-containing protein [Aquimarina sp. AD1]
MNKIFLKTILAGIIVVSIYSCGKDQKESKKEIPVKEEVAVESNVDLNLTDSRSEIVFDDDNVTKIYDQYLLIKRGLVNSNFKVVQQEAKKMDNFIKDTDQTKQLKSTTKLIALTKDIKKQRDFFVTLTVETEKLINTSAITSGEVYKQFCPMAFDGNGGYWLSDSKEVRNPYYGNKMLKCGSVNETIK